MENNVSQWGGWVPRMVVDPLSPLPGPTHAHNLFDLCGKGCGLPDYFRQTMSCDSSSSSWPSISSSATPKEGEGSAPASTKLLLTVDDVIQEIGFGRFQFLIVLVSFACCCELFFKNFIINLFLKECMHACFSLWRS